ncbi:Armadillo-type fold [Artemisia annua]|uniref:Armadillo-type fold n=1 Tax=Artemisia annua TaxID=35608 RepID=A0A2U1KDK4_ARTAN|nr:Armadillo-type fold [Artemisia annua]
MLETHYCLNLDIPETQEIRNLFLLDGISKIAVTRGGHVLRVLFIRFKPLVLTTCAQADTWGSSQGAMFESVLKASCEIIEYGWTKDRATKDMFVPGIPSVTGEPIHHTIPLLATRISRHEDRLNDIVNVINGLPCGHITEDVNNLIIGQMAVESKVEQIKTEFSESMEFIAALCSANVTMGDVLTSFDHDLEQISAQNFSLACDPGILCQRTD